MKLGWANQRHHRRAATQPIRSESGRRLALRRLGLGQQTRVSIQRLSIRHRHSAEVENHLSIDDAREAVGSEMVRALLGYDDEMRVGDSVAVDQVADALHRKDGSHASANTLSDGHDVGRDRFGNIAEMVDVCVRDDEAFSRRRRLESHERRHELVPVDEAGWRALGDDLTEDARHGSSTSPQDRPPNERMLPSGSST
jgi:hypothetical protein